MGDKMNRRNFLKKIGAVCIGAVTVPTVATTIKKEPSAIKVPWARFYAEYSWDISDLEKFRMAFKNTKFQTPLKSFTVNENDTKKLLNDTLWRK